MSAKARTAPRGFSLVEVMVALIVICIGLLGIAKLEALMLSSTGTSRLRSLVALQAASLASVMHADRDYWDGSSTWNPTGGNNLALTATETAGSTTWAGSPAALSAEVGSPPTCQESSPGTSSPPTCTSPQDMAAYDLSQWGGSSTSSSIASVLKNSTTTIDCSENTAANNVVTCTITITWNENTIAANTEEQQFGAPTPFQAQTYTLVIEP
jgi:type IV pilus assembly protein PilV